MQNIQVIKDLSSLESELDFVLFGSSIHYVNNYKQTIQKFNKIKSKFLIFSHTPFYKSDKNDKDIVMKQVNIHPTIKTTL